MQDRFRFRLFDTRNQEMIYDVQQSQFNYHKNAYDSPLLEGAMLNEPHIIKLMQCTGLKDKSDKLIYEGDIVEIQYLGAQISLFKNEYSKQPENERFEVFCHEDWLKFYAKNDHYRKTCEIHSFDLEKIRINTDNKIYKVIGNIYENPELLQGDNNV